MQGAQRGGGGVPMLPPCLCKCYHMVCSRSLSPTVLLSCSASLSQPITGAVFDCGPDKQELYDLSPGLAVPSPGLILKPNCSPSQPLLLSLHPLPPFCSCRGRLFSGRKWIAPRWAQEPERSWERGEPPSAGPACCQPPGECGRAPLWHTHQPLCPPPHRLTACLPQRWASSLEIDWQTGQPPPSQAWANCQPFRRRDGNLWEGLEEMLQLDQTVSLKSGSQSTKRISAVEVHSVLTHYNPFAQIL